MLQWATCTVFLTFIGLAMAELGSAMPTSGGLYYWTFAFSSLRWRRFLSWIVGCENAFLFSRQLLLSCLPSIDANTLGLIAGVASVDWGCAVQVMAAASIGSDMTFAPTTQQTLCVPQCAARGVNLIIGTLTVVYM